MIRSKILLFPCLFAGLLGARAAAPVDLGHGLLYCRVHALPADLPASGVEKKSALVLDLRYVAANDAGGTAFSAWLGFHTGAQPPVFILVNAGTSPALLCTLAAHPDTPGVVTLGPSLPGLAPDVPLNIPAETDRRAYDALEHGASVESLIVEKINKPRYDEAAMVKEHASDSEPPPDENSDAGDDDTSAAPPKKPAPPPQLIDLELQRAVQLDRALLALHKIPAG